MRTRVCDLDLEGQGHGSRSRSNSKIFGVTCFFIGFQYERARLEGITGNNHPHTFP